PPPRGREKLKRQVDAAEHDGSGRRPLDRHTRQPRPRRPRRARPPKPPFGTPEPPPGRPASAPGVARRLPEEREAELFEDVPQGDPPGLLLFLFLVLVPGRGGCIGRRLRVVGLGGLLVLRILGRRALLVRVLA